MLKLLENKMSLTGIQLKVLGTDGDRGAILSSFEINFN